MPISFTSREALLNSLAKLSGRRKEVYDFIAQFVADDTGAGPSIEDIARGLGVKESTVCGRVNELLHPDCAALELAPVKLNATGNRARTYRALVFREYRPPVAPQAQLDFFGAGQSRVSPYATNF